MLLEPQGGRPTLLHSIQARAVVLRVLLRVPKCQSQVLDQYQPLRSRCRAKHCRRSPGGRVLGTLRSSHQLLQRVATSLLDAQDFQSSNSSQPPLRSHRCTRHSPCLPLRSPPCHDEDQARTTSGLNRSIRPFPSTTPAGPDPQDAGGRRRHLVR